MSFGESLIQSLYKDSKLLHEDCSHLKGYWQALYDYGIWKDGVQVIGCMNKPITEVFSEYVTDYMR